MPGNVNAPDPEPEVSWKDRSEETGVALPFWNTVDTGESPRATRAWITRPVELGSVTPGVATVLG